MVLLFTLFAFHHFEKSHVVYIKYVVFACTVRREWRVVTHGRIYLLYKRVMIDRMAFYLPCRVQHRGNILLDVITLPGSFSRTKDTAHVQFPILVN